MKSILIYTLIGALTVAASLWLSYFSIEHMPPIKVEIVDQQHSPVE